jgi:hypothetical protein
MSKKYDVTTRTIYRPKPAELLEFLHFPVIDPGQLEVLDSNVSTLSAEIDRAIRVGGPEPYIVHIEFLSGRDLGLPARAFWYNVLLTRQHELPVRTVIVLLRPVADGPELTGIFEQSFPGRGPTLSFWYDVIRIWQVPPEALLTAGLSVLPLAPVSNVAPDQLEAVVMGVAERLKREADPELMTLLWAATRVLMGLRYKRAQVQTLIEGVQAMIFGIRGIEESWAYQDMFAKAQAEGEAKGRAEGEAKGRAEGKAEGEARGAIEEARNALLRVGRKKLGEPDEKVLSRLSEIADLDRLHFLLECVLDAERWEDLFLRFPS